MATKLFLRETTNNGIGSFRDMGIVAGEAVTTGVVNTAASGTQIQWTKTAGGAVLEWISGRVPAGGFTLAGTMSFSIWALESNMNANAGGRARVFKRTAAEVESEVGGGPYNDGVEFGTGNTEMTWTGAPTSTVFAEDDRIIVRYYITNVGTMASGHTCTISYDAADAATGDSFFQINENVTFKADTVPLTTSAADSLSNWLDALLLQLEYRIASADNLNNWADAFALTNIGFSTLAVADDLNSWLDSFANEAFGFVTFAVSDDLNNWLDGTLNTPVGFLIVSITGDLNNWNDAQPNLYEYRIPITDQFALLDSIELRNAYLISLSDSLANYLDAVVVNLANAGGGGNTPYKDFGFKVSIDIGI